MGFLPGISTANDYENRGLKYEGVFGLHSGYKTLLSIKEFLWIITIFTFQSITTLENTMKTYFHASTNY